MKTTPNLPSAERWEAFAADTGETPLEYVTRWSTDERLAEAKRIILAMLDEAKERDASEPTHPVPATRGGADA